MWPREKALRKAWLLKGWRFEGCGSTLQVRTAMALARDHAPCVDVLVNNAGVDYDTHQTALTADLIRVRQTFETNLFGTWAAAQAFAPGMHARGWGRIVNVSSGAGSLADMGHGPPGYISSKAALNALTRLLAAELAGTGVLVNSVCPGDARVRPLQGRAASAPTTAPS